MDVVCWSLSHHTKQTRQGTFGPFFPNQRAQVPLWLALTLKRQKKCRIVLPDWLEDGACLGLDFCAVRGCSLYAPTPIRSGLMR